MPDIVTLAGGVPALHPERKGQLNKSPLRNWVERNGGLPTYINSVATALLREHPEWGISRVIATAVNWAKKACSTGKAFGGKVSVSKAVQTAACAAVAAWEKKKAQASDDTLDDAIIAASEADSDAVLYAKMRKHHRAAGENIPDLIALSDEDYFTQALSEPYETGEEGDETVNDMDAFMEVMELSTAAQKAMRLPLNLSEATKVGDRYRKEILRTGEIVVDNNGRTFNFTPKFLKQLKNNFERKALDYVPLLYTKDGEVHNNSAAPGAYAGTVTNLSLDDETNPTKLYGDFNLTDVARQIVEHNPKFGVSVTAHPNYVDKPRGEYYGPMLLDVAATHKPKLTKMGDWEKVTVNASDEVEEYDVIDLSDSMYTEEMGGKDMEKETNTEETVQLSDEQMQAFMQSEAFQTAVNSAITAATKAKDEEITRLSSEVGNLQTTNYATSVKAVINQYRNKDGKGVPPIMLSMAEELMLSFTPEERNATIKLSSGEGDQATTEEVNRVQLVTKLLDEAQGFVQLSGERGSEEDLDTVELSGEEFDKAAQWLANMANNV